MTTGDGYSRASTVSDGKSPFVPSTDTSPPFGRPTSATAESPSHTNSLCVTEFHLLYLQRARSCCVVLSCFRGCEDYRRRDNYDEIGSSKMLSACRRMAVVATPSIVGMVSLPGQTRSRCASLITFITIFCALFTLIMKVVSNCERLWWKKGVPRIKQGIHTPSS